jgi:hypothetical protein
MAEGDAPIENLEWLRAGEVNAAHRHGVVHHRGTVEDTDARAGGVWTREATTGQRQTLIMGDAELRCH